MALDKTAATHGPGIITLTKNIAVQSRNIEYLKKGEEIDVIWTMTNPERETELLPIRIPLLKGLLGHRICLIRKGDESRFVGIKSKDDFVKRGLVIGSGHDWPDTKIVESAGFKTFTGGDYRGLFKMLEKKRFDCYNRGVTEVFAEAENHKDQNLVPEPTLALVYQAPIYFFVNPSQTMLAERIEKGLRLAIADGSFDTFFKERNAADLSKAGLEKRTIIRFPNPILPPKTPTADQSLWLNF